jgi:hypothetical protein
LIFPPVRALPNRRGLSVRCIFSKRKLVIRSCEVRSSFFSSARAFGSKLISYVELIECGFPRNRRKVFFQSLEGDQVVFLLIKVLFKRTPNVQGL